MALLVEYRHDRLGLLVHLGTLLAEASADLTQLTDHEPSADLHRRFLGWARTRAAQCFT